MYIVSNFAVEVEEINKNTKLYSDVQRQVAYKKFQERYKEITAKNKFNGLQDLQKLKQATK